MKQGWKRVTVFLFLLMCTGMQATEPAAAAVCSPWKSGNWYDATIWSGCTGGSFPQTGDFVNISGGHTVTLNGDLTGYTFQAVQVDTTGVLETGGGSRNLNTNAVTVYGTFRINAGGYVHSGTFTYDPIGTLEFADPGNAFWLEDHHVFWPTTNGPRNVTASTGGLNLNHVSRTLTGLLQTSGALRNVENLVLADGATLQINSGGYVSGGGAQYGPGSTLRYNVTGPYTVGDEWHPGTSGAGVPHHVTLAGSTALSHGSSNAARRVQGNLLLDFGTSLTLSSAIGGDFELGGYLSAGGATFNANNRLVTLNGSGDQALSTTDSFAYLAINKPSGEVSSCSLTVEQEFTIHSGRLSLVADPGCMMTVKGNWTNHATVNAASPIGGKVRFAGTTTIGGSAVTLFNHVEIATGATVTAHPQGMNVAGNWHTDGTFHRNGAPVGFYSNQNQTLSGSAPYAFGDVTIGHASNSFVTLAPNTRIDGVLTLGTATAGRGSGLLDVGSTTLTLGPSATVVAGTGSFDASRMILAEGNGSPLSCVGSVRKLLTAPGTFTFPIGDRESTVEYSPATVTLTGGTYGPNAALTVCVHDTAHPSLPDGLPGEPTTYLTRFWTINASDINDFTASTTFTYQQADVEDLGWGENSMVGGKWNGTAWVRLSAVDADANSFSGSGIRSFSDFAASDRLSGVPTTVTLAAFEATTRADHILVEWETATELDTLGFNLLRAPSEDVTQALRLNGALIPSQRRHHRGSLPRALGGLIP